MGYEFWQLQSPWPVLACAVASIFGGFPIRVVSSLAIWAMLAGEK
jgi:hypothetical protein